MIRIVTDTSADITVTQAKALGVELVALDIHFEGRAYEPLKDETFEAFYTMLAEEKKLPKTSQPAPADFLSVYKAAKEAGDDVIVITLTAKLSGTYQSAMIARDMADYDCIFVIDSLSTVTAQRLLVELAVTLRAEGKDAGEIAETIADVSRRIRLYAGLDTLKYLRKGGRIPKTMEMLGTVMGIKPLITLKDGGIVMAGKARGRKGAMEALMQIIAENPTFDPSVPVYFGYTGDDTLCAEFRRQVVERYGLQNTRMYPIGAVVGTHVGPGAFAIIYLPEK